MHTCGWLPQGTADMPMRQIPEASVQTPVLKAAQVQAVWSRLLEARRDWLAVPVVQRAERLATLAAVLRTAGPAADEELLARSTGLSTAGMRAAWDVTFAPWTRDAVQVLLRDEGIGSDSPVDELQLPARLVHVLAGNVLPPTWSLLARGWLLGAAQWLRPSAREPLFASVLLARVAQHEPQLAAMTAVTWWPHVDLAEHAALDPMAVAVLEGVPVATLHGDDASVDAFDQALSLLPQRPRLLGYGSRWSAVVLQEHALTREHAQAVARDIALFDQQGCLSPTRIFVPPCERVDDFCGDLADALAVQERQMPRGEPGPQGRASLRHWQEVARWQQSQGRVRLWAPENGTYWSVLRTTRADLWSSPLDRHVLVHPVADSGQLRAQLGDACGAVQGVAVDGSMGLCTVDPWVSSLVATLQPSHVARTGTLQEAPPHWRQDDRAPLRSWCVGVRD